MGRTERPELVLPADLEIFHESLPSVSLRVTPQICVASDSEEVVEKAR